MQSQRPITPRATAVFNRRGLLRAIALGAPLFGANVLLHRARGATAQSPAATRDNAVLRWNQATLNAISAAHPGPPMAARALAVVHTCMYDAWATYDESALPTTAPLRLRPADSARSEPSRQQAVSFAAFAALNDLFPSEAGAFAALLAALGYDAAALSEDGSPAAIGTLCAAAVLEMRHADGSNQLGDLHPGAYTDYTGYQPVNSPDTPLDQIDPDRWQPLYVANTSGTPAPQQYIGPFWGLVTPFALTSGDQFRPSDGPALYGSDAYQQQADQLLAISAALSDEQKVITEYWADGPGTIQPPGHWCAFAQFVSRRDAHDFDADVQFFFILGNALLDAGIACWDAKRAWDSIRPITAVHYLYRGRQIVAWGGPFVGTRTMPGENWLVYQSAAVVTPAFPEFFSGHSTFSAAAAEVLARFTGDDAFGGSALIPAKSSALEPGAVPATDLTLSWDTFSAAADQAGMSRRYGGIHFERGDLNGRAVGRLVGAQVWEQAQAYISGAG